MIRLVLLVAALAATVPAAAWNYVEPPGGPGVVPEALAAVDAARDRADEAADHAREEADYHVERVEASAEALVEFLRDAGNEMVCVGDGGVSVGPACGHRS